MDQASENAALFFFFFFFDELTHLVVVKETGSIHSCHLHTCLKRVVRLFLKAMLYEMAKGLGGTQNCSKITGQEAPTICP